MGTSNDSRDIMKGPSALATRSRGLLFCFLCKFHALFPFERDSSVGEGYSPLVSQIKSHKGTPKIEAEVPEEKSLNYQQLNQSALFPFKK